MITGIRIDKVEAWREKPAEIRGLDINISVDTVKVTGPEVEVNFTYMATYPEATGSLLLKGRLADETQKLFMSYVAEMGTHTGHLPEGVTLSRWDVGPGTMEAELTFAGLPVAPAGKTPPTLRFKAGFENDEQRQLAMNIKEKIGAKAKLSAIISLRNISMNGADASFEVIPSPVGVLRMSGALLSHETQDKVLFTTTTLASAKLELVKKGIEIDEKELAKLDEKETWVMGRNGAYYFGKRAKLGLEIYLVGVASVIKRFWEADRKLPDAFSELVLNAINFTCGTNGVLVVRPVNLAPPMVPPRIQLGQPGSTKAGTGTQ